MSVSQLFLDVETKLTFDAVGGYYPDKLGISFVGVIQRLSALPGAKGVEHRFELFESDLDKLWPLLETADVIIGFNLIGFDLPTFTPYYHGNINNLPALDLLDRVKLSIGRRISLDSLAKETLNTQKTGHGLDAIRYFQKQEFDKLARYCMKDVEITRDLYDFGITHGYVQYKNHWNNLIKAPVDFHYTASSSALQMTLV